MKRLRDLQFKEAIQSHLEWTWRLKEFIRGREILDRHIVAQDNQCPLGEWIYAEGQKYQHLDEYVELKELHTEFHRRAAELMGIAESGDKMGASRKLQFGSVFWTLSNKLVDVLHRLEWKIGVETSER